MTKARRPLKKMSTPAKDREERLAKALRENLHRRKAQTRLRAAGNVTDDLISSSDKNTQKKSVGDCSNG